jgi:hypothetical protein
MVDGQDLLDLRALFRVQAEFENHIELHDPVVVQMPEVALLALLRHHAPQVRAGERGSHDLREAIV